MRKQWGLAVALCLGATVAAGQTFPKTSLSLGMYRIEAEVAATPETRERGLMFRKEMAQHQGMVFAFAQSTRHCMWMRNTLLPLSVAFIDEQGRIINIEEMKPQTETNHCAARDARYALEMNAGWFKAKGFQSGAVVVGVDRLRASY